MTPAGIPVATKIKVLRGVAGAQYAHGAIGTVALNNGLSAAQVKDLVREHGYPDKAAMLNAATRFATEEASRPAAEPDTLVQAPITQVQPDPANVRDDLGDLTDLTASLEQTGMQQPIVARRRGDQLVIVMGHRRRAAALRLGWTTVPVIISSIRPDDVLAAMLIENTQRRDLDPIEEARALASLKEREQLTDLEAGQRIGRSQPYVSARLALLDLSPEDQAAIRNNTMSLGEGANRGRQKAGKHRPNAFGKASAAHFATDHPLASAAEVLCRTRGHNKHTPGGRIGGVACGACWEGVIRSDEHTKTLRQNRRPTPEEHRS